MTQNPRVLFKALWARDDGKLSIALMVIGLIGGIVVSRFMADSKFLKVLAIIFMLLIAIGTTKFSRIIYALSGVEQTQKKSVSQKKKKNK